MEPVRQKSEDDSIAFGISSKGIRVRTTHLPGNDPERIDVAGRRTFGANEPEALRVNQFRGSAMEEPVDADPRHCGWNRGRCEAGNTDTSTIADENVSLDEHERTTEMCAEDLKVLTILRLP